jgi:hypothetical protein
MVYTKRIMSTYSFYPHVYLRASWYFMIIIPGNSRQEKTSFKIILDYQPVINQLCNSSTPSTTNSTGNKNPPWPFDHPKGDSPRLHNVTLHSLTPTWTTRGRQDDFIIQVIKQLPYLINGT